MAGVERWRLYDLSTGEEWTMPINPREMTSPFPEKNVTTRTSTAINGRTLMFEGMTPPADWQFSGAILDHEHYAQLKRWSEKRNRIRLRDHFGRWMQIYITKFEPTPKRAVNKYWRHEYTMQCLVTVAPTEPTVQI